MLLRCSALTILGMFLLTVESFAQGGAVPTPPSNSFNWLNLNRQGQSAAANYYGQVRPNFQTQNALMNLQQDYSNLNQSVTNNNNNDQNSTVRETGHAATFMNYGRYYPKLSGGGGRPGQGTGGQRR